jgi:hypothetical protein
VPQDRRIAIAASALTAFWTKRAHRLEHKHREHRGDDIQSNNARVRPFVKRSMVSASGSAAMPNTTTFVMPKSAARIAVWR